MMHANILIKKTKILVLNYKINVKIITSHVNAWL